VCIAFGARPDLLSSVSRSSFRFDLPPSSSALDPPVSLRELDYPRAPSFKRVEEEIWKSKKRGTNQCPTFAKRRDFPHCLADVQEGLLPCCYLPILAFTFLPPFLASRHPADLTGTRLQLSDLRCARSTHVSSPRSQTGWSPPRERFTLKKKTSLT